MTDDDDYIRKFRIARKEALPSDLFKAALPADGCSIVATIDDLAVLIECPSGNIPLGINAVEISTSSLEYRTYDTLTAVDQQEL